MLKRKTPLLPDSGNGITIQLKSDSSRKTDPWSAILHALLPLLCLSGLAFSFVEILLDGLQLDYYRLPFAAILLLISMIWLCAIQIPSLAPFLLILLLVIHAVFALLLFPDLYYGFTALGNRISDVALTLYGIRLPSSSLDISDARALTVFMIYPASLVLTLYYLAIYRWHKFIIILIPPSVSIALLLLLSFSPGTGILLFFLLCSLFLWIWYMMNRYEQTSIRTQRRVIHTLAGILAITMILSALLCLPGGLSEYTIAAAKTAVTDFFKDHNLYSYRGSASTGTAASGGISGGNIGGADSLHHSNTLHMRITTDSLPESTIYLPGYTAGQYSASGWNSDPEYDDDLSDAEIQYQTYIPDMKAQESFLFIEDMTSAQYPLHPYAGTQDILFPYDITASDDANATYTWAFYPEFYEMAAPNRYYLYELSAFWNSAMDDMGSLIKTAPELSGAEQAYYLSDLDSQQNYSLYAETFPAYLSHEDMPDFTAPHNLEALIEYIQERLAELCTYDLDPGPVPDGMDFTDYFLFENQKGFCMHYATAATHLFRLHGVPARYAEGYIARPSDFKKLDNGLYQAELKDNRAHAWTEIYLTGIGWIPVETTTFYLGSIENGNNDSQTPVTETPDSPDEGSDTDADAPDDTANTDTDADSDTSTPETSDNSTESSAGSQILIILVIIAGSVILLTVLTLMRRSWMIRRKKKQLQSSDKTAALLLLYHEFRQLYQFLGKDSAAFADDYPALYQIVQKASFSPHRINNEEYDCFLQQYKQSATRHYELLPLRRRLLFRFYYCFLTF